LNRKARGSFVGRPCLLRIQTRRHDSDRFENCRAGAPPPVPWQPERLPTGGRVASQFPVRASQPRIRSTFTMYPVGQRGRS
jgi:hypothetical protein